MKSAGKSTAAEKLTPHPPPLAAKIEIFRLQKSSSRIALAALQTIINHTPNP